MAAAALSSSRRALHAVHRHLLLRPAPALRSHPTPFPCHFSFSPSSSSPSSRFFATRHPEARLGHNLLAPARQQMQRLAGRVKSFAISSGGSKLAPLGQEVKGLGRPVEAAKSATARYRQAVGLQVNAFLCYI